MFVSDLPAPLILGLAFVLGATWGSFFNVAIYRWPRELSVVSPPSACPACGSPIPAARNVPIFAYLFQRGRAACCGAKLTPRYVVVEVLSALLLTALAQRFIVRADPDALLSTAALETASWFVFVGGLVVATFVDLEWMEIPDEVTMGGTALGLATLSLRSTDPLEAGIGAGLGFLVVQLVMVWGWERWTGRRGMGEGDAKLMLLIGVFCGWQGALFAMVAGALQGIVAVVVGQAAGRPITSTAGESDASVSPGSPEQAQDASARAADHGAPDGAETAADESATPDGTEPSAEEPGSPAPIEPDARSQKLPFGPFLALAAIEYLFFGDVFVDWYVSHYL